MTDREFIKFMHQGEKLKCNTRHSWTSSSRKESVAEHSWRLTLMALLLADDMPEIDYRKVIEMGIIHDLGEAVTGDIPSFLKTEEDSQVERTALESLLELLPSPQKERMEKLYQEMEEMKSPEAKVYKALDKLEAVIQHNEAPLSTWLPLEYELNQTYGNEEANAHPRLRQLRDTAIEDTKQKLREEKGINEKSDVSVET